LFFFPGSFSVLPVGFLLVGAEALPLYAYRCTQCGYQYDKIQKFSEAPDTVCPQCGGVIERPLTAPALQFKGAGWYINDYAPKAASGGAGKPADGSSKPAADAGGKTDAAPAVAPSAPASSSSASSTSTASTSTGSSE
jgi:putative FmdB family regulatory protein